MIDAHHHLWDPDVGDYPWMTGDFAALRRRYDVEDLRPHLVANGVAATIVVQVRADLAETVELLESRRARQVIVGVVGWVDLTRRTSAARSTGCAAVSEVGIWSGCATPRPTKPTRTGSSATTSTGDAELTAASGLTFDLEITARELAAASALVRGTPNPLRRRPWGQASRRDGLVPRLGGRNRRSGASPNVWCKLSGLVTEASWDDVDGRRPAALRRPLARRVRRRAADVRLGLAGVRAGRQLRPVTAAARRRSRR